jgi:hypothetical protein
MSVAWAATVPLAASGTSLAAMPGVVVGRHFGIS